MPAQTPLSNITNQTLAVSSFPPVSEDAIDFVIKIRRKVHSYRIQLSAPNKSENDLDINCAIQIKLINSWYKDNIEALAGCQTFNDVDRLVYRVWEEESVLLAWVWMSLGGADKGSKVAADAPSTAGEVSMAKWMLKAWNEVAVAGEVPLEY
jgi:hypothetical protein